MTTDLSLDSVSSDLEVQGFLAIQASQAGSLTVALVALILASINILFQYANFGGRFESYHKEKVMAYQSE